MNLYQTVADILKTSTEILSDVRDQYWAVRGLVQQNDTIKVRVDQLERRTKEIQAGIEQILAAVSPDTGEALTGFKKFGVDNQGSPPANLEDITMSGTVPTTPFPADLPNNEEATFELTELVSAALAAEIVAGTATFTEPTLTEVPGTGVTAGTLTQQPSVAGTPNADGSVPYTTACVYVPNASSVGTTTIQGLLQGTDEQNLSINIVGVGESITGFADMLVVPTGVGNDVALAAAKAAKTKVVKAAAPAAAHDAKAGDLVTGQSANKALS